MSATARSLQTNENFVLVQEDTARSIACDLFRSVCDLMSEREVARLTSGLSDAQEELFSTRIAERKSLTEGVSNIYLTKHFREDWDQIERLGYREWKILDNRAVQERIAAFRERQKAVASQSAEDVGND